MRLQLRKPFQTLDKAYARQAVSGEKLDTFCRALAQLMSGVDEKESDEYHTALVANFLNDTFYGENCEVSTPAGADLIVRLNSDRSDSPGPSVVIETRKAFAGEMITPIKNNVKSLHELILYYFEAHDADQPTVISQLVITDVYNWFIFDAKDFRTYFYENPRLRKLYQLKRQHQKDSSFFYAETARILRELNAEIPVTYLNMREVADALKLPADQGNRVLIPIYKLLAPDHLLNASTATGTNNPVHQRFYEELLHIIGVQEVDEKFGRRLDRLPENDRQPGSLIELVMERLVQGNSLATVLKPEQYGTTEADRRTNVALALCINWLNRILFLKLAESQTQRYAHGNKSVEWLTIGSFAALDDLFSDVASKENASTWLPVWATSLFEKIDLEKNTLSIGQLQDGVGLTIFNEIAVGDAIGDTQSGQLPTLHYLVQFLDSYVFSVDAPALIESIGKPLINASTLLNCWNRIGAYRQNALLAPASVTNYTVREAIRRVVVTRFNEQFGWDCADLADIQERLTSSDLTRANELIDALRILDPAVGGGAFLSAALHELIVLKAELGVLRDPAGRPLQSYGFEVIDNDLLITTPDNEPFDYFLNDPNGSRFSGLEIQRIQGTLFREKQTLMANCLFGVDNDPITVTISQWRLAVELLKHVYGGDAETQAGKAAKKGATVNRSEERLRVNLRFGNVLISGYAVDFKIGSLKSPHRENVQKAFKQYRADRLAWKRALDSAERHKLAMRMQSFRELMEQTALADQKELTEIRKLEAKLAQATLTLDFAGLDTQQEKLTERLQRLKTTLQEKQQWLTQAFEWRFEFPGVLDVAGNFVGFDVVIGVPPTSWQRGLIADKSYYQKAFSNTYTSKASPYVLFVELGLRLLKPDGQLAFGLPANWVKSVSSSKLRQWLKTKAIEQVTDFADQTTSPQYTVWPGVLIVRNAESTGTFRAAKVDSLNFFNANIDSESITVFVDRLVDKAWALSGNNAS